MRFRKAKDSILSQVEGPDIASPKRHQSRGPTWSAWYALIILMVAFLVAMVDRVIIALLVGPIQRDLTVSDTQFGVLNGLAFSLFYLVMGMPIARAADKHSRRSIIAIGIALWSVMTALCGMAQNFWQLFFARMGVGVGEAALTPAAYSMIADMFPRDRLGRAYGIYSAGAMIGFGGSLIIGGTVIGLVGQREDLNLPLIGPIHSWQAVFMAVGIPGLLIALLALTMKEPERRTLQSNSRTLNSFRPFVIEHAGLLTLYIFGFGCLGAVLYGSLAWLPALMSRSYGLEPSISGLVLGAGITVACPLGTCGGGLLADWFTTRGRHDGPILVALIGAVGGLLFVLSMPLAGDWRVCSLLISMLFFFISVPIGAGPTGIQMITPSEIRAQMGALYVIGTGLVGLATGSLAIGAITDYIFKDKAAVGASIATFGSFALLLMIIILLLARGKFAQLNEISIQS